MFKNLRSFVYFFVLLTGFAFASSANALVTSPLRFDLTLFPGSSSEVTFMVENDEVRSASYKIFVNSLVTTEDGKIFFQKNVEKAEKWVSFNQSSFTLKSGEARNVKAEIDIPLGETPGSRSLAIMVKKDNDKDQVIGLSAQNAIPLLLTVSGVVTEKLEILKWQPNDKIFYNKPLTFLLNFRNSGNVNVETKGIVRIKDLFGREIMEQPARLGTTVFSNSSRNITVQSAPKLLPGVYKAEILIRYGQVGATLKGVATFWYIPIWSIALVVFLLIFTFICYWFRKKTYAKAG